MCLVASVVLDLDVQILASLGAEILATAFVRADKRPVNLVRCASEMLLPLVLALLPIVFLARFTLSFLDLCLDLTLASLFQKALLVLLLPQTVEEFVRLGQDLRNQGVLVKVLDVEYLPTHFVILRRNCINLLNEVLLV